MQLCQDPFQLFLSLREEGGEFFDLSNSVHLCVDSSITIIFNETQEITVSHSARHVGERTSFPGSTACRSEPRFETNIRDIVWLPRFFRNTCHGILKDRWFDVRQVEAQKNEGLSHENATEDGKRNFFSRLLTPKTVTRRNSTVRHVMLYLPLVAGLGRDGKQEHYYTLKRNPLHSTRSPFLQGGPQAELDLKSIQSQGFQKPLEPSRSKPYCKTTRKL